MEHSLIGFVVGLRAEARLLRKYAFMVGIGGGFPAGAARAAEDLIAKGAEALISFGLAGGLDPNFAPGAILIPEIVLDIEQNYLCDRRMADWIGKITNHSVFAGADIAVTAAQKSRLFQRTNATAIDLESGAVARVAASHNIPFAVLRAIADPAERDLPPAALMALNAAGKISLGPILGSVLSHPGQIPALIALAKDAAKARRALVQRLKILA